MPDELLAFPIDIKRTLKYLRQDMKDDWFFDTVHYEDLLTNQQNLLEILQANLTENDGEYREGLKAVHDVPKSSLGLRYTLETDFYDRFIYQAICTYLIPFFDPLLSNRVLSHRYNKNGTGRDKQLFKHRIELWNTFENITHVSILDGKTLLVTDLLNYFEHITIDAVEQSFINMLSFVQTSGSEKHIIRSAISTLIVLLKKWCFNADHGLPQNRDASSFIANIVLNTVDRNMIENGYDYFRYVDDIRIVCEDEFEAKRALNALIMELRNFGLNINSKKTDILNCKSDNLIDFFPSLDDRIAVIDSMWRSRSKKVITRSIPVLHNFLLEQVDEGKTQGRPFRFCINRFKTLISSNLFDAKSVLAQDIAETIINEFSIQPVSTDQFCKLLMDLDLLEKHQQMIGDYIANPAISIYGWQNYQLILLLAYKKYEYQPLIDHCISLIENDISRAEIPACFIYLASIDRVDSVLNFINKFESNWPYQHQRFFLIALQDVPPKQLKPLFGKVAYRLKGTVKRLKENRLFKHDTIFLRNFYKSSISNIYDEISPYE